MNELTTQGAESDYIEGTFRNAEDPPPVERVVARGYATLPPRPSPPQPTQSPSPPSNGGRYVYPKRKPISPYAPDWLLFITLIGTVLVVLWFFSMLQHAQGITGP